MIVSGSTGQQNSLSLAEKLELLTALNDLKASQGFELLFGVASIRIKELIQLVSEPQAADHVASFLLGFPPYIRLTQAEAIYYVRELISHTSKPVVLYNNPARTGFIPPPHLAGIKEAAGPSQVKAM